jgi:molybdenum ABC transporter molybdate-binding protein
MVGERQMIINVWHADSLAGPMSELKKAFEVKNPNIVVQLTSGRSKELAERLFKGETCDIFAPSDPQVVQSMLGKSIHGKEAAAWYIAFSANELVVITQKGNPLGIRKMTDLSTNGVVLARVSGENDMGTNRTIEFVLNAATDEGHAEQAQQIIDNAVKAGTVPGVLEAVQSGKANTGIVYLSAAVSIADKVDIIYFPAKVNLSKKIVNVVTIPGTAQNVKAADSFIKLMLAAEGRQILQKTGQPPIVPPIKEGIVPFDIPAE